MNNAKFRFSQGSRMNGKSFIFLLVPDVPTFFLANFKETFDFLSFNIISAWDIFWLKKLE